jgi:dihydroflavonol-4-reductase
MPTLVTGATGFLGGHLVAALLERGDQVRALVRTPAAAEGLGVEVVPGDITDADAVRRATAGCDQVFHLAGVVSHDHRDLPKMRAVNVDATRSLLAAVEPGARVVHVSSVAAVGPAPSRDARADEQQPFPATMSSLPYATTKHEGELVALEAAAAGVNVVIANPAFLLGPGDVHRISTWPIDAYLSGKLRVRTPGGLAFADARDIAAGLILLSEKGHAGERTLLVNPEGNLSWHAFFELVGQVGGKRRLMVSLPAGVAALGSKVAPSPVSAGEIRAAGHWWFYDGSKAERELGFRCRPIADTIADTIADHQS